VGGDAFEQMVLARIVEPTSKADSVRVLEQIGVEHASLRTIFRSVKRCQERGYRDTLAAACYEHASTAEDLSLVLYDGRACRSSRSGRGSQPAKSVRRRVSVCDSTADTRPAELIRVVGTGCQLGRSKVTNRPWYDCAFVPGASE